MTFLRTLAVSIVLLLGVALAAGAQDTEREYPDPLAESVSDFAGALTATEEGRITRILSEIRESTGVQIVVVTAPGLAALNGSGMRLEDFGRALFDSWGIGDQKLNDGILFLIDTDQREARITLGKGYAAVYDDRAARVLATALLPELRQGRMAAGVEAAVILARDRLVLPYQAGETVGPNDGFEAEGTGSATPFLAVIGGGIGLLALAIWRRARSRRICPKCKAHSLQRTREVINAPTKFQSGLGLEHQTCAACGFTDRTSYPIRYSGTDARRNRQERSEQVNRSGRDDDDGFGGGESGKGGASGKW